MRRLVCHFLGHRWNVPTWDPYKPMSCERCGLHI